jgi:hypothetical protein
VMGAPYESVGTWFAAEEVAKRARAAQRFSVGDRVKYAFKFLSEQHPSPWFGTVDTVYNEGDSYLVRFEHDGQLRGRYYAEELEAAPAHTLWANVAVKIGGEVLDDFRTFSECPAPHVPRLAEYASKLADVRRVLDHYKRYFPASQDCGNPLQTLWAAVDLALL